VHPLALEDILSNRTHARSKADYYIQHLFIRVLGHTVVSLDEDTAKFHPHGTEQPRSASPAPMTPEDKRGREFDDEVTVFGSAPVSKFSMFSDKVGSVLKHRGSRRTADVENAPVSESPDTLPTNIRRQSTVGDFLALLLDGPRLIYNLRLLPDVRTGRRKGQSEHLKKANASTSRSRQCIYAYFVMVCAPLLLPFLSCEVELDLT